MVLCRKRRLEILANSFVGKRKVIRRFFLQHSNPFIAPNQAFQLPLFDFEIVGSIFITNEEKYELDSTAIEYRTGDHHSS